MSDGIYINVLPLPAALVSGVASGIWQTPKNRDVRLSLFPADEVVQPLLYALVDTQGLDSWVGMTGPGYLGRVDEWIGPGDIDQSRAVLIGDLGPDKLIALDYRQSEARPSVIALTSHEHFSWRRVADDIESFMQAILLSE